MGGKTVTREIANERVKGEYAFGEDYKNTQTKSNCECLTCGHIWSTIPSDILRGFNCPECSRKNKTLTLKEINIRAMSLGYKFLSNYVNTRIKCDCSCMTCENIWEVMPRSILHGNNCPICSKNGPSKGEKMIIEYLDKHNIKYHFQWSGTKDNPCKYPDTNGQLYFDFYLPDFNLNIEFHGKQHFHTWGIDNYSIIGLYDRRCRDLYKEQYLKDNGINQEVILWHEEDDIPQILDGVLDVIGTEIGLEELFEFWRQTQECNL